MIRMVRHMTFGNALREAREEAGLTQTEFAKLIGVSFSSINRYENGHHEPTAIVLNAIKVFFKKKNIPFVYDRKETANG